MSTRIVLKPGELYYGDQFEEVYTLLGSCVAAVLWHPKYHLSGMCHVVYPEIGDEDNYSYAESAIRKLYNDVCSRLTNPNDYRVEVFGGGNMFPNVFSGGDNTIGNKNTEIVTQLLSELGFKIKNRDVGGVQARKITLFRDSGKIVTVYVKENPYDE